MKKPLFYAASFLAFVLLAMSEITVLMGIFSEREAAYLEFSGLLLAVIAVLYAAAQYRAFMRDFRHSPNN